MNESNQVDFINTFQKHETVFLTSVQNTPTSILKMHLEQQYKILSLYSIHCYEVTNEPKDTRIM